MRPIRPTKDAKVRIEKLRHFYSEYQKTHPWWVLTRYPDEPGYTLVGSFETWDRALKWCSR